MKNSKLNKLFAGVLALLVSAVFTSGITHACESCNLTPSHLTVKTEMKDDHSCCLPKKNDSQEKQRHCNSDLENDCISCATSEAPKAELISHTIENLKPKFIDLDFISIENTIVNPFSVQAKRILKLPRSDLADHFEHPLKTIRFNC